MKKKDIFLSIKSEQIPKIKAVFRSQKERYVMNMYQLQSIAGLTFKEARAFLLEWYGSVLDMAMDLGVGIHAIYNMQRRAKRKIAASGHTLDEIFVDYPPMNAASIDSLLLPITSSLVNH
jgi:hypothetical protein